MGGGEVSYTCEDHIVPTTDGWKLYVKRYKPQNPCPVPVVLCHGVGANGYSLDFHGDEEDAWWRRYSLAYYLLTGGDDGTTRFDVWVPELRGRKASQTFHPAYYPEKYDWNVDTYIDHDVPDIVTHIKQVYREEGHPNAQILWVGKSMGGMLAYAYGMTEPGKRFLKGVVTIASPVMFDNTLSEWGLLFDVVKHVHPRKHSFPLPWIRIIKRLGLEERLKNSVCNRDNMNEDVLQEYIDEGADNTLSLKVFLQFIYFIKLGGFCRYPKHPWLCDLFHKVPLVKKMVRPYSYKEHLHEFETPVLMITGAVDNQAPRQEIAYAYEHVGTKGWKKKYHIFSKDEDTPGSCDYGHLDINYGEKARDEVYPIIYRWLKQHCTNEDSEVESCENGTA